MLDGTREIRRFLALVARHELNENEIAALVGVSVPTARILGAGGLAPRCLHLVRDFNERNGRARSREALRMPPRVKTSPTPNATEGPRAA